MKAKANSSETVKKAVYYLDESIQFLITIVAIILSDFMAGAAKNGVSSLGKIHLNWLQVLMASLIAILVHGASNDLFKYDYDKEKPPFFKRAYNSVIQGLAWRSIVGMTS